MSRELPRAQYVGMFGPTAGDRVRLERVDVVVCETLGVRRLAEQVFDGLSECGEIVRVVDEEARVPGLGEKGGKQVAGPDPQRNTDERPERANT